MPCGGAEGLEALTDSRREYVICTTEANVALCPITGLAFDVEDNSTADEKDLELTGTTSKEPNALPISSFKFSTSTPCINFNNEPGT